MSSSKSSSPHITTTEITGVRLEAIFHALAGSCGMVFESCINHPLDTLKTRYQLISNLKSNETLSILKMSSTIFRTEGIFSFYRGLPMVILMQIPRGFLKFGTNYSLQHLIHENCGQFIANVNILNFMAGVGTGFIDGLAVAPFEFIKVRMQSSEHRLLYRNTFQCLYHTIIQQRNIFVIYRGLELTLWRNSVWHGIYFGCLGKQKQASERFGKSIFHDFIFGCVGGGLGSIFSSPFDVAKSRLQNSNIINVSPKVPWALMSVYQIYRAEGFFALYRGFLPKILRLGFGGGILMFSFEFALTYIEMVHLFCTRIV